MNKPNQTELNQTDEFSKSPEPKRIELSRCLPAKCAARRELRRSFVYPHRCALAGGQF